MLEQNVGFIGGGRATRIILGGLEKAGRMPGSVVVSDTDNTVLARLKKRFPRITIAPGDNQSAASFQDIVFISVHPPVLKAVAGEIRSRLNPDVTIISLMATISIAKLREELDGIKKILRMSPNAPSIVNAGFNPVAFYGGFTATEKKEVIERLSVLGRCPVVEEEKLESYAILTAMGPTYLWFQLYELERLGREFG
ncbi:MAG: pyrroline-5-carboxylate reductase family protein, partial [Thermodesulfobacteriota bacterium]